jgi:HPt (histidine-containing phosphotransfer) domain-containing protein
MYYILNQNEQIVAVDPQLLSQLSVENADEFYKKFALAEITFKLLDDTVTISNGEESYTFPVKTSPLSGILGDLVLIDIDSTSSEVSLPTADDELISYSDEKEPVEILDSAETLLPIDDDILFDIKDEDAEEASSPQPETIENGDELFELVLPTDADNAISEIESMGKNTPDLQKQEVQNPDMPIYIDIESISEKIGISTDDYNLFLNEYIDTALTLEEALQSDNTDEQNEALNKLSHLSNVLHLPFVNDLLDQIKQTSETERDGAIESFFATLGRLTTARFDEEKQPSIPEKENKQPAIEERSVPAQTREPIDLSHVKPIHFDFQLEEAAKDLSLPVELIEEFVHDFIQQAHEETEKMLAAYEKGDLETIQKIGHLLKGTSSNLRITPLADTLYEIQFNEDIDRVPELVKNYWGHFRSLENQIKLISN